jgi:hypothetical protein
MPTAVATSQINILLVSIETQKNFLTRTKAAKEKELVTLQTSGNVKKATTLSTEIESQKTNLLILGKMRDLLNAYVKDNDLQAFLASNQQLQKDHNNYGRKWSLLSSAYSLFASDPASDIYTEYNTFVTAETKPLVDAQKDLLRREDAELNAYMNTDAGREMGSTLAFILRGG